MNTEDISNLKLTGNESRALELLGSGISPVQTAAALGISESRISQLLSEETFATAVAQKRFTLLQANNARDSKYDAIEDALLDKLRDVLDYMVRPMEIIRALTLINSAKRRGSSAPEVMHNQQTVVNLVMPTQIINKFTVNTHNQVIKTEDRNLITIQSSALQNKLKALKESRVLPNQTNQTNQSAPKNTEVIRSERHDTTRETENSGRISTPAPTPV